jgi:hypothetical protein
MPSLLQIVVCVIGLTVLMVSGSPTAGQCFDTNNKAYVYDAQTVCRALCQDVHLLPVDQGH